MAALGGAVLSLRSLGHTLNLLPPKRTPSRDSLDLSKSVVLVGSHYNIGEHADLWIGVMRNKKVAVKFLRSSYPNKPDFLRKPRERLERDAPIWRDLNHPNVSEFYGLAFNFGYMPALISPFYENGNVVEYVREKDDEAKLDMVRQTARGLKYLHENSVVHGDLRGTNILVDDTGCARICDHGLAFIIELPEFTSVKTAGACRWTAPEVIDLQESIQDADSLFTEKSDIYSYAMAMLEIFTGKIPFSGKNLDNLAVVPYVLDGGRPDLPPFLKDQECYRSIFEDCWAQDPYSRPISRVICERLAAIPLNAGSAGYTMTEHADTRIGDDMPNEVAVKTSPVVPGDIRATVDAGNFNVVTGHQYNRIVINNYYNDKALYVALFCFLICLPLLSFGCNAV